MKTIFDNIIKLEINESAAKHLYYLLEKEVEKCQDLITIEVYLPVLHILRKQIEEQQISREF